jgi:membrane protein DedA with SNARE-associated domain
LTARPYTESVAETLVASSSVENLVGSAGLFILFVLIAMESAGIPLPGETALIAAGVLASRGKFDIVAVIAVAASGAIVGDNIGYWLGREGGRKLLTRSGWIGRHAMSVLPWSERFFRKHGAKTVFVGRFVAVLRVTAAWLAGMSKMPWWRFLAWNAAGGICWAILVGLVAYYAGNAAADAIGRYGLYAAGGIVALLVVGFFAMRYWRRRMLGAEAES